MISGSVIDIFIHILYNYFILNYFNFLFHGIYYLDIILNKKNNYQIMYIFYQSISRRPDFLIKLFLKKVYYKIDYKYLILIILVIKWNMKIQ